MFGKYKPVIEGFPYDPQTDPFSCPAGKTLPFKTYDTTADGGLLKRYRAPYQDGKRCPLKATCVPKGPCRQITRTAYDAPYRRALPREQSRLGQPMRHVRQSSVEPVFGSLLPHYGLRQVNTRSRASAQKTMRLAAVAYHLKKLLKHPPKQRLGFAVALPRPPAPPPTGLFPHGMRSHQLTNRPYNR